MEPVTVIVGASAQKERYSYLAFQTLAAQGLPFALVNPKYSTIDGCTVYPDLDSVPSPVGTVSLYVAPGHQETLWEALLRTRPQRVIFNPGSENPSFKARIEGEGIPCLEACTLVLLRTGQF